MPLATFCIYQFYFDKAAYSGVETILWGESQMGNQANFPLLSTFPLIYSFPTTLTLTSWPEIASGWENISLPVFLLNLYALFLPIPPAPQHYHYTLLELWMTNGVQGMNNWEENANHELLKWTSWVKHRIVLDPAIPLLDIYPGEKIRTQKSLMPMFIPALFTTVKMWKQPKSLSTDEWINKIWWVYAYNRILFGF